jgi:hypothetical protein
MYGILPGYKNGVEANAVITAVPAPAFSDSITVIYADYTFPLWEYNMFFTAGSNGGAVTLTPNAAYSPAPPPINGAGGIQQGDLIMISGGGLTSVGEVFAPPTATGVSFANLDALNMNQSGALSGNLAAVQGLVGSATAVTAYRIYAVTYYLNVPAAVGQTPRLMRQVNGLTPTPVADDIINLQFAFDVDNAGALDANQANPIGVGELPNNIQKVNIVLMGQSIVQNSKNSQSMYLATSVSARNMTFRNRYQ